MPDDQVFENKKSFIKNTEFALVGVLVGLLFLVVLLLSLNYLHLINLPFSLPKQTIEEANESTVTNTNKELVEVETIIKPEIAKKLQSGIATANIKSIKYFTIRDPENIKNDINFYLIQTNALANPTYLVREMHMKATTPLATKLRYTFFPVKKNPGDITMRVYDSDKPNVIKEGLIDFKIQVVETADENALKEVVIPTLKSILEDSLDPEEERLTFSNQIVNFLKTSYQLSIYDEENKAIEFIRDRSQQENKAIDKIIDNLKEL